MRRPLLHALGILALFVVTTTASAESKSEFAQGQQTPQATDLPTIAGTPIVGSSLTTGSGSWTGPATTYAYPWDRCNSSGAACSAIGTATTQRYIPVTTDIGSTLRVVVTATNKNGSAVAASPATTSVDASTSSTPAATTSAGSTTTSATTTVPSSTTTSTTAAPSSTTTSTTTTTPTTTTTAPTTTTTPTTSTTTTVPFTTTTFSTTTTTPTATPFFDGRASLMSQLGCGGSDTSESPHLWDGIGYINCDVTLVRDSRYGKAYRYYVDDS
jgi:hypothetical protein